MQKRDLTVVLTLKDRSNFTYRWMRWMDYQRFPYKILIADGGSDGEIESHLLHRENYPSLDYEYIRYPFDSTLEMYIRKLANVSDLIKTEFVLSADNDDLILLKPLEENLCLMREEKAVHTLGPPHCWFKVRKAVKSLNELVCIGNDRVKFTRDRPMAVPVLEDADPLKRLLHVVERVYSPVIYYGIHRSDDYKRINHGAERIGFQRRVFREWHTLYSYAIAGTMMLGRTEPFMLRQEDTSQSASEIQPIENLANIYLLPDWSQQLYGMMDDLYLRCVEMGSRLERSTFDECFRDAYRKQMVSWLEFRGLADRFRKFPNLYALGRSCFALYCGTKSSAISRTELVRNQALHQAVQFLREYTRTR